MSQRTCADKLKDTVNSSIKYQSEPLSLIAAKANARFNSWTTNKTEKLELHDFLCFSHRSSHEDHAKEKKFGAQIHQDLINHHEIHHNKRLSSKRPPSQEEKSKKDTASKNLETNATTEIGPHERDISEYERHEAQPREHRDRISESKDGRALDHAEFRNNQDLSLLGALRIEKDRNKTDLPAERGEHFLTVIISDNCGGSYREQISLFSVGRYCQYT
ncbi:hypothetical protein BC829DRAFT_107298 [Chytridium lagenaria]|nr:hypothetical protein BC829DRAFT_107298 [Chytridium lagenaria]